MLQICFQLRNASFKGVYSDKSCLLPQQSSLSSVTVAALPEASSCQGRGRQQFIQSKLASMSGNTLFSSTDRGAVYTQSVLHSSFSTCSACRTSNTKSVFFLRNISLNISQVVNYFVTNVFRYIKCSDIFSYQTSCILPATTLSNNSHCAMHLYL